MNTATYVPQSVRVYRRAAAHSEINAQSMTRQELEAARDALRDAAREIDSALHLLDLEEDVTWYDLGPNSADLFVAAGSAGHDPDSLDPDSLPAGFRWVGLEEWHRDRSFRTLRAAAQPKDCSHVSK